MPRNSRLQRAKQGAHRNRVLQLEQLETRATPATMVLTSVDSLPYAIHEANSTPEADVITFDPAVFANGPQTIVIRDIYPDRDNPFVITGAGGPLKIIGPGADKLIISGEGSHIGRPTRSTLFEVQEGASLEIAGVKLTKAGSKVFQAKGAILVDAASLTLTDVWMADNNVRAVAVEGLEEEHTISIRNSTFSGNPQALLMAGSGGATLNILQSTFANNSAEDRAGVIDITSSVNVLIASSTIADNSGIGVKLAGATAIISNSVIAGNGIPSGGTLNDAQEFDLSANASVNLQNSFNNFIGNPNTAGGIRDSLIFEDGMGNIVGQGFAQGAGDPLLSPLQNNGGPIPTMVPEPGSRLIDSGSVFRLPGIDATGADPNLLNRSGDQRGETFQRLQGAAAIFPLVDIGAVEVQKALQVSNLGDADDGNINKGELTLREALRINNERGGNSVITFDSALFASGPQELLVTTADVVNDVGMTLLREDVTLIGPGAELLTIKRPATVEGDFWLLGVAEGVNAQISHLTLTNGQPFHGNSEANGAIVNRGTLLLTDSELKGNVANFSGGAIMNEGTMTILRSTLAENRAGLYGGAIYNGFDASLTIENSTLAANQATFGGAIVSDGELMVRNATVVGNHGISMAGGIDTGFEAVTTLHNTIVAGNTAGFGEEPAPSDLAGDVNPQSHHNLIGDALTAGGLTNGVNGNIVGVNGAGLRELSTIVNPTLANNGGRTRTHALVANSPAINAGNSDFRPGSDLDQRGPGFQRIGGSEVDIGALETGAQIPTLQFNVSEDRVTRTTFNSEVRVGWEGTGPAPTGRVDIYRFVEGSGILLGTGLLQNGVVTAELFLLPGNHELRAIYHGDANFIARQFDLTKFVTMVPTTVGLATSANAVTVGQPVTFTATVSVPAGYSAATGTVIFTINSVAGSPVAVNGAGVATFTTTASTVGAIAVTATYNGDSFYSGSTSSAVNVTVNDAPSNQLTLTPSGQFRENQQGAVVGTLSVTSTPPGGEGEGEGEEPVYEFFVSDTRFEVVDGVLKLKNTESVTAGSVIELTVSAEEVGNPANSVELDLELTAVANPTPWQNPDQPEDVDGDGTRNIQDVIFVIRILRRQQGGPVADTRPAPVDGGNYADVNGDNIIDIADAIAGIRYLRRNPAVGEGEADIPLPSHEAPIPEGSNADAEISSSTVTVYDLALIFVNEELESRSGATGAAPVGSE